MVWKSCKLDVWPLKHTQELCVAVHRQSVSTADVDNSVSASCAICKTKPHHPLHLHLSTYESKHQSLLIIYWVLYMSTHLQSQLNTSAELTQRDRATAVRFGRWIFNTAWIPTTLPEKSPWPVRQWRLATCITAPLSHAVACNVWSAVWAQPTS